MFGLGRHSIESIDENAWALAGLRRQYQMPALERLPQGEGWLNRAVQRIQHELEIAPEAAARSRGRSGSPKENGAPMADEILGEQIAVGPRSTPSLC